MTVKLAIMRPGRSASGRRYFRGTDTVGNHYWLLEEEGTAGHRWILKVDPNVSMAAPEDRMKVISPAPSARPVKQIKG